MASYTVGKTDVVKPQLNKKNKLKSYSSKIEPTIPLNQFLWWYKGQSQNFYNSANLGQLT